MVIVCTVSEFTLSKRYAFFSMYENVFNVDSIFSCSVFFLLQYCTHRNTVLLYVQYDYTVAYAQYDCTYSIVEKYDSTA